MIGTSRQRKVRFDMFEHFVAVHVRHHDVEQDQVERLSLQALQRLAPVVGSREVLIALPVQTARQRVTIVLVIVDDQERGV